MKSSSEEKISFLDSKYFFWYFLGAILFGMLFFTFLNFYYQDKYKDYETIGYCTYIDKLGVLSYPDHGYYHLADKYFLYASCSLFDSTQCMDLSFESPELFTNLPRSNKDPYCRLANLRPPFAISKESRSYIIKVMRANDTLFYKLPMRLDECDTSACPWPRRINRESCYRGTSPHESS